MKTGEIVGDMSLRCFSLMHGLILGPLSDFFYSIRQQRQFWAKISTRFSIGGLLFHNGKEYGKSKNISVNQ